jgi:hypothetical protein
MTYGAEQYVSLMLESRRQFLNGETEEAQIACNVAEQYWKDLTPVQRRGARKKLAEISESHIKKPGR